MRASRWGLLLGALAWGCGGGTTVVYIEAGATPMDAAAADVSTACPDGQRRCGERCVDVNTDRDHCGSCGLACPGGRSCTAGSCQLSCPTGQTLCDDRCATLSTDRAHCGRCGNACGPGRVCADGACGAQRRCTVRRELSVNWVSNCRGPGGGNAAVVAAGLPAGTYEVTPLRSAGTVWNPVSFPSTGWMWSLTCDNLAAPTLTTGGTLYPTPDAAFAAVASRTERVRFAGGDLTCAFSDNPCNDNQGGVSFRVERVCE